MLFEPIVLRKPTVLIGNMFSMLWEKVDLIFKSAQNRRAPMLCSLSRELICSLFKLHSVFRVDWLINHWIFLLLITKWGEAMSIGLTFLCGGSSCDGLVWIEWVDDYLLNVKNRTWPAFMSQKYFCCQKCLASPIRHRIPGVMASSLYQFMQSRGCETKVLLR